MKKKKKRKKKDQHSRRRISRYVAKLINASGEQVGMQHVGRFLARKVCQPEAAQGRTVRSCTETLFHHCDGRARVCGARVFSVERGTNASTSRGNI